MWKLTLFGGCLLAMGAQGLPLDENSCPYAIRARKDFQKNPILHKYQSAQIPVQGWYAYTKDREQGIYWSSLSEWKETRIPNTNLFPMDLQISENGEWIAYSYKTDTETGIGLIRRDGTGKVEMPVPGKVGDIISWIRNSPFSNEIAYWERATQNLMAIRLNFGSTTPTFGEKRILIEKLGLRGEIAVNGAHVVVRGPKENHVMYTLPDNGKGKISAKQNSFTTAPPRNCGITISPDGSKVLSNQGRVACLDPYNPGIGTGLHKGFLMIPFVKNSESKNYPSDFEDFAFNHGVSLNRAPEEYKDGRFPQQEFHHWYWSNFDPWVVSIQQGASTKHRGVWLVNWKSNEWFMLSPEGREIVVPKQPAIHITDPVELSSPGRHSRIEAGKSIEFSFKIHSPANADKIVIQENGKTTAAISSSPWTIKSNSVSGPGNKIYTAIVYKGNSEISRIEIPVHIVQPQNNQAIDKLSLFPANSDMVVGAKVRLDILAFDYGGKYVPIQADKVQWNYSKENFKLEPVQSKGVTDPVAWLTALKAGPAKISATIPNSGSKGNLEKSIAVHDFSTNWVRINMRAGEGQKAYQEIPSPEGWLNDFGHNFGLKDQGYVYGFHTNFPKGDIAVKASQCPVLVDYPDIISCTGLRFTSSEVQIRDWEMEVPNGQYHLKVIATKKVSKGTNAWILAEGSKMLTETKFPGESGILTDEAMINVTDGRLTIQSGRRIAYPMLYAVELKRLGAVSIATQNVSQNSPANPFRISKISGNIRFINQGSESARLQISNLAGKTILSRSIEPGNVLSIAETQLTNKAFLVTFENQHRTLSKKVTLP